MSWWVSLLIAIGAFILSALIWMAAAAGDFDD